MCVCVSNGLHSHSLEGIIKLPSGLHSFCERDSVCVCVCVCNGLQCVCVCVSNGLHSHSLVSSRNLVIFDCLPIYFQNSIIDI